MSSKKLNPFRDFQSDQIQSSRKIFTAHFACRNAALNLIPVTGTTNRFIFQITNSLIESWGVRLTCLDCNRFYLLLKKQEEKLIKFTFVMLSGTVTRDRKKTLAKYIVADQHVFSIDPRNNKYYCGTPFSSSFLLVLKWQILSDHNLFFYRCLTL